MILAIDPGPTESAWVVWDGERVRDKGQVQNEPMVQLIDRWRQYAHIDRCVIEMIGHYGRGMPVGKEVFDTCVWIGRFKQEFDPERTVLVLRPTVKAHICGTTRAKDSNIRQALIDRFGKPGNRKAPGLLYGITGDLWAALALAVTWWDQHTTERHTD